MQVLKTALRHSAIHALTAPFPFATVPSDIKSEVSDLNGQGYTSVGQLFSPKECQEIRDEITARIGTGKARFTETSNYHVVQSPLTLHRAIEKLLEGPIPRIAEAFFRRQLFLSDVDCRRVYPCTAEEIHAMGPSSSNWHKDIRGRQIKMMVYLTDVGPQDSTFAFVPGSQNHRTFIYSESRFSDTEIKAIGTPIDWTDPEGTGMLFDTNIVHRLTRRATAAVRDTLTLYFTPGQSLHKIDFSSKSPEVVRMCTGSNFFKRT